MEIPLILEPAVSRGGSDRYGTRHAVTCAAVACREDFSGDDEGGYVGAEVEGNVCEDVEHDEAFARRVEEICPCAACGDEEGCEDEEPPELDDAGGYVFYEFYHQ